jgi:hypothetical protein
VAASRVLLEPVATPVSLGAPLCAPLELAPNAPSESVSLLLSEAGGDLCRVRAFAERAVAAWRGLSGWQATIARCELGVEELELARTMLSRCILSFRMMQKLIGGGHRARADVEALVDREAGNRKL